MHKKRFKTSKNKIIINILIIIFIMILIISTILYLTNIFLRYKETKDLNNLSEVKNELITTSIDNDNEVNDYEKALIDSNNQLHNQNSDMIGWIKIANTTIDYPVMYTPDNFEKYLRKDFSENYSLAGLPFLGVGSSVDDPQFNTIIYSHNMHNGTMFSDILNYESQKFREENPIIEFSTLQEVRKYEVVAAFRIDVVDDPFKYYNYTNWNDETNQEFIDEIKKRSYYTIEEDFNVSDQMLTLSTCDYNSDDGRFVVVAKRIDNNP